MKEQYTTDKYIEPLKTSITIVHVIFLVQVYPSFDQLYFTR